MAKVKATLLDKANGEELATGDFEVAPGKDGLEEWFTATDVKTTDKNWKAMVKKDAVLYLMPAKTKFKIIKASGKMMQGLRTK